jgi:site-specific DNA recombinase
MSRPRRVLAYARVSSQEQALGTSLQDQQNAISTYAKARGLTVTRFYVEAQSAISEKIERRTQMLLLLREARTGDLVVCDKLDRWSRDTEWTLKSVRELREKGASFYSVADQCDPETPGGEMMLTMRAMMAKEEHTRIKIRLVGTRKILRDYGFYIEGLPPLGYVRPFGRGHKGVEKNILAIEPKGAEIVRKAFRLCIKGKSLNEIAAALDIKRDRVHDILGNRLYVGEMQNSRGEWMKGKHEPIIDAATFAQARAAVASRRLAGRKPKQDSETSKWLLRDIARCGHCGAKMSGAYAGDHGLGRRHYYRCFAKCTSAYVPVKVIEEQATPLVIARLAEVRELIANRQEPVAAPAVDYGARRARIQQRRDRHLEAYADGHMTRDELRVKMAKLDEEQHRIDAEEALDARPSALADKAVRIETIRSIAVVEKVWRLAAPDVRRGIIEQLASVAHVAYGVPLRFTWRSPEDLAADLHQ